MNGVGGKRTADGSAEERAKMGGHWAQGGGKEVDRWRQGGVRTADGSAEKRAKIRGVATQWAPEGSEWRIETHQAYGASQADTGRSDADAIRRTHILFLMMFREYLWVFVHYIFSGYYHCSDVSSGRCAVDSDSLLGKVNC